MTAFRDTIGCGESETWRMDHAATRGWAACLLPLVMHGAARQRFGQAQPLLVSAATRQVKRPHSVLGRRADGNEPHERSAAPAFTRNDIGYAFT